MNGYKPVSLDEVLARLPPERRQKVEERAQALIAEANGAVAFPPSLAERMMDLTRDIEVDLDAPIDGPVSI
jgi:hypothetical protein